MALGWTFAHSRLPLSKGLASKVLIAYKNRIWIAFWKLLNGILYLCRWAANGVK